jgi:REP element-mobilizing transposase RayT
VRSFYAADGTSERARRFMIFELFDPTAEYVVRDGANLPHWYQPGVTYFVTFRTEDSIPAATARTWHLRRADWLYRHSIDANDSGWHNELRRLDRESQRYFHETFSREYLESLDRGLGACPMRDPALAQQVADSLMHFDGQRYVMSDFIVMPNHVHLLYCLLTDNELEAVCYSWKKFTAGKINRKLCRHGRFWQEESFDHLVRNPEQFAAIQRYIAANGVNASLSPSEYYYYGRQAE